MNTKKVLLLLSLLLLFLKNLLAQTDTIGIRGQQFFENSIKFSFGNFYMRNAIHIRNTIRQLNQVGGFYERKIYGNWHAGIGYAQWFMYSDIGVNNNITHIYNPNVLYVDRFEYQRDYKMIDIYALYKYHFKETRHFVNFGLGGSYAWGKNGYIQSFFINPAPLGDTRVYSYNKKETHVGIFSCLSYDYIFFNNRLVAGMNIKCRYYYQLKAEYDYGLQIGLNF